MILFPNAKINIGLYITEKRTDGYHNLETIFYPVGMSDILEIQKNREGPGIFNTTGLPIPASREGNLCLRAEQLIRQHYSIPRVNFHLHKIIPCGAGLGGGSSDGSFTLKALDQMFQLNMGKEALKNTAGQIGSDCPFFIDNQPSFAWEKGNQTEPVHTPLKGHFLLLVIPDIPIKTQTAYLHVKPRKRNRSLKEIVQQEPVKNWNKLVINDFEAGLLEEYPRIKRIKQILLEKGALFASLSGSGSALYGIFAQEPAVGKELAKYTTWTEELPY
jgi:4-diphosphocytidyl-2-C-methyl-D-erythritol kinase